ncbi:MAG: hypothetical protein ACPGVK_11830 [Halocynthiibacter sp.]
MTTLLPSDVTALFTHANNQYRFARWERPIAPIVFGVEDQTLQIVKGAIEAMAVLVGHQMAETDPELGSNFYVFFIRDWSELTDTPNMDQLIPELENVVGRLQVANATQYRAFRFEDTGAIQAAFLFVRMTDEMQDVPADLIAIEQAVRGLCLWSETAFKDRAFFMRDDEGHMALAPEIAAIAAAAYDRVMPVAADDASHGLRLFARLDASVTGGAA